MEWCLTAQLYTIGLVLARGPGFFVGLVLPRRCCSLQPDVDGYIQSRRGYSDERGAVGDCGGVLLGLPGVSPNPPRVSRGYPSVPV